MITHREHHFMKRYELILKTAVAFILAILIQATGIPSACAADSLPSHVYLKLKSLSLKEYDAYGNKINEETGAMLGIGYKSIPGQDSNSFSGGGEVFYGTVETNVISQKGTLFEDKNKYIGLNLHGNMNFILFDSFLEDQFLMATGGLGLDCWIRSIGLLHKDTASEEIWTNFYGRAGLGFYLMKNVYISGGVKFPFWTQRHIGDFGLNLNPSGKLGVFIEPTIIFKHLTLDLFYESSKYGESDMRRGRSGKYNGWQPASVGRSFGISARSNF
jgi:hypothetical protein